MAKNHHLIRLRHCQKFNQNLWIWLNTNNQTTTVKANHQSNRPQATVAHHRMQKIRKNRDHAAPVHQVHHLQMLRLETAENAEFPQGTKERGTLMAVRTEVVEGDLDQIHQMILKFKRKQIVCRKRDIIVQIRILRIASLIMTGIAEEMTLADDEMIAPGIADVQFRDPEIGN